MSGRRACFAVALALVAVSGMACGGSRQFVLQGSDRAPGADGNVLIERQEGGNYLVTLTTANLLPPPRLNQQLTTYVVWFQPSEQTPQRVGVLAYNPDDRTGSMSATTAVNSFEVLVSGEAAADVAAPSEFVVYRAAVQAPEE